MHESESKVAQPCLTLSDPMDCSLPGSSVHGIFQAKVLEWGAIAFSYNLPLLFKKKKRLFLEDSVGVLKKQGEVISKYQT